MNNNLSFLPDILSLKKVSQSLAMLDAILSPQWETRHYSFNSKWSDNSQMGSMRDGSGKEYFILFTEKGVGIKVFDPSRSDSKNDLSDLSEQFSELLTEPAFSPNDITYCLWRDFRDIEWHSTSLIEGEDYETLQMLSGNPELYRIWSSEYYGQDIPPEPIDYIFSHKPLTDEMVKLLNPKLSVKSISNEVIEIGYPIEL